MKFGGGVIFALVRKNIDHEMTRYSFHLLCNAFFYFTFKKFLNDRISYIIEYTAQPLLIRNGVDPKPIWEIWEVS